MSTSITFCCCSLLTFTIFYNINNDSAYVVWKKSKPRLHFAIANHWYSRYFLIIILFTYIMSFAEQIAAMHTRSLTTQKLETLANHTYQYFADLQEAGWDKMICKCVQSLYVVQAHTKGAEGQGASCAITLWRNIGPGMQELNPSRRRLYKSDLRERCG